MENITSIHDLQQVPGQHVLIAADVLHGLIHEGSMFLSHANFESIADNATRDMYWKAPDSTVRCFVTVNFEAELAGHGEIRESATVTLSGTVLTAFNANRNSALVATAAARSSPTFTGSGTVMDRVKCGGGKQGTIGGAGGSKYGFIAKQGTVYLFRFTSKAASNEAIVRINWAEVTP